MQSSSHPIPRLLGCGLLLLGAGCFRHLPPAHPLLEPTRPLAPGQVAVAAAGGIGGLPPSAAVQGSARVRVGVAAGQELALDTLLFARWERGADDLELDPQKQAGADSEGSSSAPRVKPWWSAVTGDLALRWKSSLTPGSALLVGPGIGRGTTTAPARAGEDNPDDWTLVHLDLGYVGGWGQDPERAFQPYSGLQLTYGRTLETDLHGAVAGLAVVPFGATVRLPGPWRLLFEMTLMWHYESGSPALPRQKAAVLPQAFFVSGGLGWEAGGP